MNNSLEIRLGVAGTAKNTGKTTATASIIRELRQREIRFFLTSIGYDGEDIDNITGLPKPKLRVESGDIVVTAEKCLISSTAILEILEETNIYTPLGRVIITEVKKSGLVVTAGPNKSSEVRQLNQLLRRIGPGVTVFDGALSRIAPMTETDGFILATGAAKTLDIPRLVREAEAIWYICNLPIVPQVAGLLYHKLDSVTVLNSDFEIVKRWPTSSLLLESDILAVLSELIEEGSYLYIPGVVSEKALSALYSGLGRKPKARFIIFADSIKMLVVGDTISYYELLNKFDRLGVSIGVIKKVPLLAISINPFYPEYQVKSDTYTPAYIDFNDLKNSVQKAVNVPVYNVVKEGGKGLVDIVMKGAHHWEIPTQY